MSSNSSTAKATSITPQSDGSFHVEFSKRDLDTLMFLSHCVKINEHLDAGKPIEQYAHSAADAAGTLEKTLEVLFEGVRRSGSWERGMVEVAFREFDNLRITEYHEYLEQQDNNLHDQWSKLDDAAGAAEKEGRTADFEKLLAEIETVEAQQEALKLSIEAAEKLCKNPGFE